MAATWTKESLLQAIKSDPNVQSMYPTLAADILARQLSLSSLVEYLKDLLIDPDPSQRAAGLVVLTSVLQELPLDFLLEDELRFVVTFFCDRLKDHHAVIPSALRGIRLVLRMKNFPQDQPVPVLTTLVMNINCHTSPKEDRLVIYQILDLLVIPHLESLKALGPNLVYHVVSMIDGEQDPHNLKFLFAMLPALMRELPLSHLADDVFEALSCYFPIDYRPTVESAVTRKDLASALEQCLTAIPDFTNHCISLALEKIDTPLQVAKMDSMHLLITAFQVFPPGDVASHLSPLWMSLSREALFGPGSDIRVTARQCVRCLLHCLSKLPLAHGRQSLPLMQLLGDVISACDSSMSQVHTNLFTAASDLLLDCAKSCTAACEHITAKVMPQLVDSCSTIEAATDRSIYLHITSKLLTISKSFKVTPQTDNVSNISVLWSSIVQLYFTSAQHESHLLRREAMYGLSILVSTLNQTERARLYNTICSFVDEEDNIEVREQTLHCLHECAICQPAEVEKNIVENRLVLSNIAVGDPKYERRLEGLCCLAHCNPIGEKILSSLFNTVATSTDSITIHKTVSSLRKLLQDCKSGDSFVFDCLQTQSFHVPRLVNWWLESTCKVEECNWVMDEKIISEMCFVIRTVTRTLTEELQKLVVSQIMPLYFPGNLIAPCDVSSPEHHNLAVAFLEAVLCPLHPSVSVPNVDELCFALAQLAIHSHSAAVVTSACRLCANLINKIPDVFLLNNVLARLSQMLDDTFAPASRAEQQEAAQAAALYGWLIKALAMRGYGHLQLWIDKLTEIMNDKRLSVCMAAGETFKTIMLDSDNFLDSENHCTLRLFYKQRVFEGALKFVRRAREKPHDERIPYLYALAYLLMDVPVSALTSRFSEVAPLFLETLSQDSAVLLEIALGTLTGLLLKPACCTMLRDHVQTLVPRLAQLVIHKYSMQVRRSALHCLFEISNFPAQLLLPFKDEVSSKLLVCLDDKKRLVRKDAVKARTAWLMVGAL